MLLDAVQSIDAAERVTFVPVGTAEDGYTSAVIEVHDHSTGIIVDAGAASANRNRSDETVEPSPSEGDSSASRAEVTDDTSATANTSAGSSVGSSGVQRLSYAPQKRKVFSLRVGMVSHITFLCDYSL